MGVEPMNTGFADQRNHVRRDEMINKTAGSKESRICPYHSIPTGIGHKNGHTCDAMTPLGVEPAQASAS
jgi:hypothetical protein